MNKERKGLLFIGSVLISYIIYIIVSKQYLNVFDALKYSNKLWLLLSLVSIFAYWLIESKIIQISLVHHHKIAFVEAVRLSMIGQFFSGLTPFSTGGQPAQVVTLKKMSVSPGVSTSALVGKFVVYQLTLVVYTAILLLVRTSMFVEHLNSLISLVFIGFVINLAVISFLVTISFSKKFNFKLSRKIVWFLYKIRVIKEKEKTQVDFDKFIDDFYNHLLLFKENKKLLLKMIGLTIVQLTTYFIVPFLIYKSFGLTGVSILDIVAATAFVLMLTSFIPLPGASGGAEGGFYLIFSLFFLSKYILPALLLWRLITYYFWMGVGGIWMLLHRKVRR